MADIHPFIEDLIDQRLALETALQNEKSELSESRARGYDDRYARLQRQLATRFKEASDDQQRVTIMLEMMRILENRLVYLQNFIVDPSSDNRILAQLVTQFIDQLTRERSSVLTSLEATYYRAVAALYAGDLEKAREGFTAACESEESDEANDIKYKSYVILGHLSHEERDYAKAKELHEQSLRYTQSSNVTAQALALKALNSYALGDLDDALHLFEESLTLRTSSATLCCSAARSTSIAASIRAPRSCTNACWRASIRIRMTTSTRSRTSAGSTTRRRNMTTPSPRSSAPCRHTG